MRESILQIVMGREYTILYMVIFFNYINIF